MMGCEIAMVIDPSVGTRIRYIRELNHYTREELAEFAEISSKFLYEIENGQKGLSAANLLKICQALEVSCDYIMTGKVDYKCRPFIFLKICDRVKNCKLCQNREK